MKIIEILSFIFSLIAMQLYVVHRQSIREIRGWVEDISIPHHLLHFKLHCQAHELEQRRLAKKSLDFLWKKDVYIQAGFFAKTEVRPPYQKNKSSMSGDKKLTWNWFSTDFVHSKCRKINFPQKKLINFYFSTESYKDVLYQPNSAIPIPTTIWWMEYY